MKRRRTITAILHLALLLGLLGGCAAPIIIPDDVADESVIVLDPVNLPVIEQALADGRRDFIGGNCTVSLMLMGLGGLFRPGR